jgi:Sensors of blue-light using FAD
MRRDVTQGPLHRLIYCSRNAMGPSVELGHELRAIVAAARRRNEADGLTGALLAAPSGFAQVLEGSRDALEQAFERIRSDPRHTDVSVLAFTPAPRRSFPLAPLGFRGDLHPDHADPVAVILADAACGDTRAMTSADLLRLLLRLVRTEHAWDAA